MAHCNSPITPVKKKRWDALSQRAFSNDFLQLLDEAETSQQAGIDLPYKSSYFPQAGWIKPVSFCHALSDHPNCKIIVETEALSLEKECGKASMENSEKKNGDKTHNWHILDKNKKTIAQAEAVIICNGRDLFNFEQSSFLPHMPVAGQTTFANANASPSNNSQKLKTVIGHEGYLAPAINNQHIFGATFERDFERDNNAPFINPQADNQNREQLEKYLPDFYNTLSTFKSAHVAVRMTTPDRFPYVGAIPDKDFYQTSYHDLHQGKHYKKYPQAKYQEGLFILGGLGSRGLTTSGLCAKNLCDLLENKASPQSQLLHYCHPARFLIKALKRK